MARIFADSDGPCKGDSCLLEEDLQRSPPPGVMRHVPMSTKTSAVRHLQQPCALFAAHWCCCVGCTHLVLRWLPLVMSSSGMCCRQGAKTVSCHRAVPRWLASLARFHPP